MIRPSPPPIATASGARGRIKDRPEDFVVEELPAYAPSGAGEHVFVRFTKTNRTTLDSIRAVARALACDPREAGFAGMKDKRAVATQTLSIHAPSPQAAVDLAARARALVLDGIVVHEAIPHAHKLKPGHLIGNRFAVVVRGVEPEAVDQVTSGIDRVAREGVPNAYGDQRFGTRGDNAERALAWLRGRERGPRDPRLLRLLWSSLQAAVFNAVLDVRVRDGTWATPLAGDLLKLRRSGGLFVCSDVQTDRERAATGEVSPTGPIFGVRMQPPEGAPAELERQIIANVVGDGVDLTRTKALGEGSRRALRVWVEEVSAGLVDRMDDEAGKGTASLRVCFVLPKGAYATTVLANVLTLEPMRGEPDEE
ncbi:MAG: tRNA pseudouridine(13) synthase TruD [Polyangiaceae bacterium]